MGKAAIGEPGDTTWRAGRELLGQPHAAPNGCLGVASQFFSDKDGLKVMVLVFQGNFPKDSLADLINGLDGTEVVDRERPLRCLSAESE